MHSSPLFETIKKICEKNPAYDPEAYLFTQEALEHTAKSLKKKHVSGQELLEGICKYAIQEFGPMALTVLREWRVVRTEDFGKIVFSLVEAGKLGKTEEDSIEHFANGYNFDEVFGKPFRPQKTRSLKKQQTRSRPAKTKKTC